MSSLSSDLLSAYLDGELSPAETAEMQCRLEADPQLQAELDALRRVSVRVRNLPRPTAPAGFAAGVLEKLATSIQSPVRSASPKRRWGHWVSGLSTLAAVVLVMIGVLRHGPQEDVPVTMSAPGLSEETLAMRGRVSGVDDLMAADEAMAGGGGGAMESLSSVQNNFFYTQILPSGRIPEAGELLTHLDEVADQPVIVEYTVADVNEAYGEFQVLLLNNSIQPVNAAQSSNGVLLHDAADVPQGQKLVALYIEADAENLGRALNGFRNTSDVFACTSPQAAEVNADYNLGAQAVSFQVLVEKELREEYLAKTQDAFLVDNVPATPVVPRFGPQPPPPAPAPLVTPRSDMPAPAPAAAVAATTELPLPAAEPLPAARQRDPLAENAMQARRSFAGGGQPPNPAAVESRVDPAPADRMLREQMADLETQESVTDSAPEQNLRGSTLSGDSVAGHAFQFQNQQMLGNNFQTFVNTPEQLRSALNFRGVQQQPRVTAPAHPQEEVEQTAMRMFRSKVEFDNLPQPKLEQKFYAANSGDHTVPQAGDERELSLEVAARPLRRAIVFIGCPSHTIPPPVPPPPAKPEWLKP